MEKTPFFPKNGGVGNIQPPPQVRLGEKSKKKFPAVWGVSLPPLYKD